MSTRLGRKRDRKGGWNFHGISAQTPYKESTKEKKWAPFHGGESKRTERLGKRAKRKKIVTPSCDSKPALPARQKWVNTPQKRNATLPNEKRKAKRLRQKLQSGNQGLHVLE